MVSPLPVGSGDPFDGIVIGLGSATGENHLVTGTPQHFRKPAPGMVHGLLGSDSKDVAAGGIPKVLVDIGQHRLGHLGVDGRGGVVVQVDGIHSLATVGGVKGRLNLRCSTLG